MFTTSRDNISIDVFLFNEFFKKRKAHFLGKIHILVIEEQ